MSSSESVQIPDDAAFSSFRNKCEIHDGWEIRYNKGGLTVWTQDLPNNSAVQKLKTSLECKNIAASTLYDVLHDIQYRKKWDTSVIETYDVGRLTANTDVGYYSCKCGPLKSRDFVTLRSWLPLDNDYLIINHSVKYPKLPPKKECVRAVSILTGYLIRPTGPKSCVFFYLAQVDPRGSLPLWVVNKASQYFAPKVMKKILKASEKYPEWKKRHSPQHKPWLYPEQISLPGIPLSELSMQNASELENIDESSVSESKDDRNGDSEDDEIHNG
uniref:START domain-containing protein 10 n=1 Tax=Myxine glutinosa TaxID=7769 RepID=UPI0035902843